jgi:hypothetical protein
MLTTSFIYIRLYNLREYFIFFISLDHTSVLDKVCSQKLRLFEGRIVEAHRKRTSNLGGGIRMTYRSEYSDSQHFKLVCRLHIISKSEESFESYSENAYMCIY